MGQKSENDDAANLSYTNLDESYQIHARNLQQLGLLQFMIVILGYLDGHLMNCDEGVIGFVTNVGWIDGTPTDGFRSY